MEIKIKTTGDIRIMSDEVDADWKEKWVALDELVKWLEGLSDNRIAVKMLEALKED
jgi:hypothetical protein